MVSPTTRRVKTIQGYPTKPYPETLGKISTIIGLGLAGLTDESIIEVMAFVGELGMSKKMLSNTRDKFVKVKATKHLDNNRKLSRTFYFCPKCKIEIMSGVRKTIIKHGFAKYHVARRNLSFRKGLEQGKEMFKKRIRNNSDWVIDDLDYLNFSEEEILITWFNHLKVSNWEELGIRELCNVILPRLRIPNPQ